jgi:hypothetical protein
MSKWEGRREDKLPVLGPAPDPREPGGGCNIKISHILLGRIMRAK